MKENPIVIPTNFKVSKSCRHVWMLFHERDMVGRIEGVPGRKEILFSQWDFKDKKALMGCEPSMAMDWMQEAIEHLRFVCLPP